LTLSELRRSLVGGFQSEATIVHEPISTTKVIGLLRDKDLYEVFVQTKDSVGLVTVRDLLNVRDTTDTKLVSVMHRIPKITENSQVQDAAQIMLDYRIRAVPVVDEKNNIQGQISCSAIVERVVKDNSAQKVTTKKIMTSNPITLEKNDQASKARNIMLRRRIDHLPVVDASMTKRLPKGVVTSSRLLFNLWPPESIGKGALGAEKQNRFDYPVGRVIDSEPSLSNISDTLPSLFSRMKKLSKSYSLVTLWDELQGIVTYRDFMKLLEDEERGGKQFDIPLYIVGLPGDPFEAEATRAKFMREVTVLRRSFPEIEEARSVIKTSKQGGATRNRYEVQVSITTPKKVYSYRASGYELPDIYDFITDWMKKLLARSETKRKTRRARVDPGVDDVLAEE
jgi:CBS domain-containing protein